jgi:hypothetical protein
MSPEAIRIPSAGAVFWGEANPDPTVTGTAAVRAITGRPPLLNVALSSTLPHGISVVADSRGIVLLGSPIYYNHTPTEAELATPPTVPAVTLAGSVQSLDGRFNPRQFSVTPSPAAPSYVPLRPSLQSVRVTEAGAVVLNVKWQSGAAASWSLLRLTCVRTGVTIGFSGQADLYGDVIIPLTGLPPLPPSLTVDNMTLTALADPTQAGQIMGNPDTAKAVQVSTSGAFAAQQSFNVKRGQISNAAALGISGVTLQP